MNLLLQAQGGGNISFLVMMVAIFVIMWFFMIRPQQKKQKEIRKFQNSLQEGSKVQCAEQGVSDFFVLSLSQRCFLVDDGAQ